MSRPAADTERMAPRAVLVEGDTCWRIARAERAAVLVDAAEYFRALRSSLLKAERSIYILGWELNSRTCLVGESDPRDGAPRELGKLLKWLLRRKKHLVIRILLWDHSVFYTPRRELFPRWIFGWRKSRRVEIVLDSHLPLGASHHEKVVVIDDAVAYCGGMDLTLRRWDSREHRPVEPRRCDPRNKPYVPVHDVQMVVDGDAARALGQRARERWEHAKGASPDASSRASAPAARAGGDCWPAGVEPRFERVPVGVMRTLAALEDRGGEIREIERSTVAAIERAERLVYIENQYITSKAANEALLARMRANPDLEAIVITSYEPGGWVEAETMGVGRQHFMAAFDEPHLKRRIHFLYPFARGNPGDEEYGAVNAIGDGTFSIHVHAKVLIIDDTFLRIGSSNLNNRSMGFDTECDLGIEGSTPKLREAIRAVRHDLMAEHWGVEPEAVERALSADRPAFDALQSLLDDTKADAAPEPSGPRRSRAAHESRPSPPRLARGVGLLPREDPSPEGVVQLLGDPEHVVTAERFVEEFAGVKEPRRLLRWAVAALVVIAIVALAVVLVSQLPADGSSFTQSASDTIAALRDSPWRVPLVLGAFVAGSIVSFPLLVMIGATVIALGPVLGFVCAALGSLLAATATFAIGRGVGRRPLRKWLGRRAQVLERRLEGRGIITVALIRKVPVAPFTIVNMLVGASGVPFREFIAGTALGLLPGIAAFAFVGDRAVGVWRNPTPLNVTLAVVAVALWIGVVLGLQRLMNRFATKK